MAIEILSSDVVFEGKVFDVKVDRVRFGQHESRVDIVVHSGAVTIVPVDADGNIWFVRQYRHAIGQDLLELPAGTLEEGEHPADTAARECREEIGMSPGRLEHLGGFYPAPGYSTEYMHVYLAAELEPDALAQDPDEIIEVEKMAAAETMAALKSDGFQDAKTLAALHLADLTHGILAGT